MSNLVVNTWKNIDHLETLARMAIFNALENHWADAIKINQKILTVDKNNIQALNRLAQALFRLGHFQKAQNTYKKVLEIDPVNIIARRNLERLTKSNGNGGANGHTPANLASVFLFEPGKTKLLNLLNLAPPQILATLNCGDQLVINPKRHAITIATPDGTYLGALPDDLAHRLINFITEGNKYEVYVKCVTTKILTVIIKEVQRSPKYANQPSFQFSFALEEAIS